MKSFLYCFFGLLASAAIAQNQSNKQPTAFHLDTSKIKIHELKINGIAKGRFNEKGEIEQKRHSNAVWQDASKPNNIILENPFEKGYVFCWENKTSASVILTFLNENFERVNEILLEKEAKLGGFSNTESGFAFGLLTHNESKYWLYLTDQKGRLLTKTLVIGDCHPDSLGCKHSPMAFSGAKIGYLGKEKLIVVFMAHLKKSSDGLSHQASLIRCFDSQGNRKESTFDKDWIFSHCNDLRLLCEDNKLFALTAGDAYPRGIGAITTPQHKIPTRGTTTLLKFHGKVFEPNYQMIGARLGNFININDGKYGFVYTYFSDSIQKVPDQLNYFLTDSLLKQKKSIKLVLKKNSTLINPKNILIDSGMVCFFEVTFDNNKSPETHFGLFNPNNGKWKQKPAPLKEHHLPLDTKPLLDSKRRLIWVEPKNENKLNIVVWDLGTEKTTAKTKKSIQRK